jgi:NADH-quinone oxidoreductase subunit G
VLLGNQAFMHPRFGLLRALAVYVTGQSGAALGYLSDGANAAGCWLAGVVPHRGSGGRKLERSGLDARAMLEQPRKAYVLIGGVEPEFDCWGGVEALEAVRRAEFVLALTPFASATMRDYADLVLPVALFAETAGTYVNAEGRWQSFQGVCAPPGAARPGWKVLRVLGNLFDLDGFDQVDAGQVRAELEAFCKELKPDNLIVSGGKFTVLPTDKLWRVGDVPIYAVDGLVRRSEPLQRTPLAEPARVRLNAGMARRLGVHNAPRALVQQNGFEAELPLELDECVPDGCIWLPSGLIGSAGLGPAVGPVGLSAE